MQSFVLISMLRGQPKTPPSGDDLAVLDYHLKPQRHFVDIGIACDARSINESFYGFNHIYPKWISNKK